MPTNTVSTRTVGVTPGSTFAILADSLVFYLAALALLTFLGAGLSALLLPKQLRDLRWLLAPYLGYSVLVVLSALLVAFGANVGEALGTALVLAAATLARAATSGALGSTRSALRPWLLVPITGLPLYAITAASMAHNGTVAYVGPNQDPYLLIPMAEWLKSHSAPMFSPGLLPSLDPGWSFNQTPTGGWLADSARLEPGPVLGNDVYFPFFRGPVYLASSLGILLGWDCYRIFRPEVAFLLSLSLPVVFLFSRRLLLASKAASAIAALGTGLNGSIFFWVSLGHPGQATTMFMAPLIYLVTLSAVESGGYLPCLAASLGLSAGLVSYYQGQPVVLAILAVGLLFIAARTGRWRGTLLRTVGIGLGVLVLAFPEHLKLWLDWRSGLLIQLPGWGNPDYPPLSDALGTTLDSSAFRLIAGQGQLGTLIPLLLQVASLAAGAIVLLFALLGVAFGDARRLGLCRSMLLEGLAAVAYFRFVSAFPYAVVKAQAIISFLLAIVAALGIEVVWRWSVSGHSGLIRVRALQLPGRAWAFIALFLLPTGVLLLNLGLGAFAFWKPVGNAWSTRIWEAEALTRVLPGDATARLSPGLLADPEAVKMTLYFLRNQRVGGPFSYSASLISPRDRTGGKAMQFEVLGRSQIGAASGYLDVDRVWSGSLLQAFRVPPVSAFSVKMERSAGSVVPLSSRLPVTLDIMPIEGSAPAGSPAATHRGSLYMGLATERSSSIQLTSNTNRRILPVDKGLSVRSMPVQAPDRISLSVQDGGAAALLFFFARDDSQDPALVEDYPRVVAAFGDSRFQNGTFSTDFIYLDVGVPVSHSVDLFDAAGGEHWAWFPLPTNPDERLKDVRFVLDPGTLDHSATADGQRVDLPFSLRPIPDGEYVAYFTISYTGAQPIRIPLYSFRLEGGEVFAREIYPLGYAWDGRYDFSLLK